MTSITSIAQIFFDACETGKGWGRTAFSTLPTPDRVALFRQQAEAPPPITYT